jgi:hypothetical protein
MPSAKHALYQEFSEVAFLVDNNISPSSPIELLQSVSNHGNSIMHPHDQRVPCLYGYYANVAVNIFFCFVFSVLLIAQILQEAVSER